MKKRYKAIIKYLVIGAIMLLSALSFTGCNYSADKTGQARPRACMALETLASTNEESVNTINCINCTVMFTVSDGVSPDAKFNWSTRFMTEYIAEDNAEWYLGIGDYKNIPNHFLTVTVSEDTQSAEVKVEMPFAVPIEVTATQTDNSISYRAVCRYATRIDRWLHLSNGYNYYWGEMEYRISDSGDLTNYIGRALSTENIYLTPQSAWFTEEIITSYCYGEVQVLNWDVVLVTLDGVTIEQGKPLSDYGFVAGSALHVLEVTYRDCAGSERTYTFDLVQINAGAV